MIYISFKDKIEKNNVKKIISEFSLETKVIDNETAYLDQEEILKKCKIIICDDNLKKIKKLHKKGKVLIIYKKNNNSRDESEDSIYYEKDVFTYNRKNELREILNFQVKKIKLKAQIEKIIIAFIALLCVMICALGINEVVNKEEPKKEIKKEPVQKEQIEKVDYKLENIVFLGDSITNFYNLDTYYKDLPVINSGTAGKKAYEIVGELKERVYIYNPTKVFLMIGTNDLSHRTDEEIVKDIKKIIKSINKNRPNTTIYVESVYPVNKTKDDKKILDWMVGDRDNERISNLNKKIKEMCKKEKTGYIDIYDLLTDEEGMLNVDYTVDGLHINENGYEVITKKLMEYIDPSTKEVDK